MRTTVLFVTLAGLSACSSLDVRPKENEAFMQSSPSIATDAVEVAGVDARPKDAASTGQFEESEASKKSAPSIKSEAVEVANTKESDDQAWQEAKASNTLESFSEFLGEYSASSYAPEARRLFRTRALELREQGVHLGSIFDSSFGKIVVTTREVKLKLRPGMSFLRFTPRVNTQTSIERVIDNKRQAWKDSVDLTAFGLDGAELQLPVVGKRSPEWYSHAFEISEEERLMQIIINGHSLWIPFKTSEFLVGDIPVIDISK